MITFESCNCQNDVRTRRNLKKEGEKNNRFRKFIYVYTDRKEGEFSLGWNVDHQLNDYQTRKQQKDHGLTGKVGESSLPQRTQK